MNDSENIHDFKPITYILYFCPVYHPNDAIKIRSAALIEALHRDYGIKLDAEPRPNLPDCVFVSDLAYAFRKGNFPAFEALLLRCGAQFHPTEAPLELVFDYSIKPRDLLPYLRALLKRRPVLPRLDPNVSFGRDKSASALHAAVKCRNGLMMTDPDPKVVRLLINGFGADPFIRDRVGNTMSEKMTGILLMNERKNFDSDAAYAAWRERVTETRRILQGAEDRVLMVLMGTHARLGSDSPIRLIDPGFLVGRHAFRPNPNDADYNDLV